MSVASRRNNKRIGIDINHTILNNRKRIAMGTTKNAQKQAKAELDDKLALAQPTRQILEDLAIACAKQPSPDNTFQYAFCLSKSTEPSELRYAVTILDGLVKEGYEHQVDCMYGASCALYLLGEYDKARVRCINIVCSGIFR